MELKAVRIEERMLEQDQIQEPPETSIAPLVLARKPILELQGLNEIRFAVWEMLDFCFPWTDNILQYQDRPSFCLNADQRDEFIRLQANAHNRNIPLIWHEKMILQLHESGPWVEEKVSQIELAVSNRDEIATIESLCKPYTPGRPWPVRGNPARWRLYAHLFNRLMLNPPPSLTLEGQLPVSDLVRVMDALTECISEPSQRFADFMLRLQESFQHGRPLTQDERALKRKIGEQKRKDYEIKRYGRILNPDERKQALRKEQIERAEEAAHQAKLRAIDAERREAIERAREPNEISRILRDKNRLILTELRKKQLVSGVQLEALSKERLQPGETRTLSALKQVSTEGLTVSELAPLTKKDTLAEETPEGSLYPWLKSLERKGLVRSDGQKPKRWFFVKDDEP
ncbi:MAG TPA: hypothetical protein V6C52_11585 [Coleofasciculaceae cyanobacterium]|jgi:hypothetical protein